MLYLLFGCPSPPQPPTPPQSICQADTAWLTNPSMPSEVAEGETFCDFYQFSWQWFLAQTSPSSVVGERVFETNRVYDPNIAKDQCSLEIQGKQAFMQALEPRTIKADKFEHIEADGGALYDQNGNILYYGVYYSEELCKATPQGFVPQTLEIKTSWMVLPKPSATHYTITLEDNTQLGLVGMHMAIWTPNHPEMIWATWEHKDNAPLCDGSSPKNEWSFSSKKASECLRKHKGVDKCEQYKFNTPTSFEGEPPLTSTPNNVCQEYAYGNEKTPAINGNDNQANLIAITQLNTALVGNKGLLTQLEKGNPMKIWSNYQMVGALWTKDGAESGDLPVPHKGGKADPNSPQRGSLELTNTTMETFQQGDQSYIPNCFGCHNYKKDSPLTVSHIEQHLLKE